MTVRQLFTLAPVLTLALFILSPVLAHAGATTTTGACCTGLACSIGAVGACDGLGGDYQGDGTACTSGVCGLVPPLNHFQCYDVARTKFTPVTLDLADDFGTSTATVRRAKMLCAPVNKNDEDPDAPDDADHLVGYEIRRSDRFAGVLDEAVDDQFGSLVLDIRRPERILVPSAKQADPNDVVTPLDPPAIDHYQCYRVRGDRRRVAGITVEDQFGTGTADVKKPSRLCLPVDKNGEGIVDGAARLMCYSIKPGPRVNSTVQVNNQLGDDELRVKRARELCVPLDSPCRCVPTWENGISAPALTPEASGGCEFIADNAASVSAKTVASPTLTFYLMAETNVLSGPDAGKAATECRDTANMGSTDKAVILGRREGEVAACREYLVAAGCVVP